MCEKELLKKVMENESSYDYDSIHYYYIVESLFIF